MVIAPYERRVYYYETDKMGVVHHSNYIRIFEETRVDFLQQVGMPFEDFEAKGIMMPVLSAECEYKKPLRFDDLFSAEMNIEKFNGVMIEITYKIFNKETGDLCTEGRTVHCFTDDNLVPIRTKKLFPDIFAMFKEYMNAETQ